MSYLEQILHDRKRGLARSLYSCCSANEDVLTAAVIRAKQTASPLLVEATANQVNQEGGYTGMTPTDFAEFVRAIAHRYGLSEDQVILGGDHLGPLVWCGLDEDTAMDKAEELVRMFVAAGYHKIHLDTSMRLGSDDADVPLSKETVACRGARLCKACEEQFAITFGSAKEARPPIYVIGSEVPIPGGEVGNNPSDAVTTPDDFDTTLTAYRKIFNEKGLHDALSRVAAVVVEMGVEFSEYRISEYNRDAFAALSGRAKGLPLGFEAHSTDYQTRRALKHMCEDGAMFLKVGPALTFAARDALFRLELIEHELIPQANWSHFRDSLDAAMVANPSYWAQYYQGNNKERAFARAFSFSDRCRYYLDEESVRIARNRLMSNLANREIPLCLLAGLFAVQYRRIREGVLKNDALAILHDAIGDVIDDYLMATDVCTKNEAEI